MINSTSQVQTGTRQTADCVTSVLLMWALGKRKAAKTGIKNYEKQRTMADPPNRLHTWLRALKHCRDLMSNAGLFSLPGINNVSHHKGIEISWCRIKIAAVFRLFHCGRTGNMSKFRENLVNRLLVVVNVWKLMTVKEIIIMIKMLID